MASPHREDQNARGLRDRTEVHRLIAEISTDLMNRPFGGLEEGIEAALGGVARFTGADRCGAYRVRDEDPLSVKNSYVWHTDGVPPIHLDQPAASELPWYGKRILQLEVVNVPRIEDLPAEAETERQFFRERGTRSQLLVPMVFRGRLAGFLAMDAVRGERIWSDDDIALLRILSELLASALIREENEASLRALNATLGERVARSMGELRAAEANMRAMLCTAADGIVAYDATGRIELFNTSAEVMFRRAAEETVGQHVSELLPGLAPNEPHGGSPHAIGMRSQRLAYRGDGTRFPVEITLSEFQRHGTHLFTLIVRDVTDRLEAARSLEAAKEVAEAANRAKSQFLATMSHEIRTPLNGILGLADLLQQTPLRNDQREYLEMVLDSAEALQLLVDDILDFSKIESGKLELELEHFRPREVVAEMRKMFAESAREKGLRFVSSVARDVPPVLCGDSGRLRQVLMNLLGNAAKFTEQGKVTLRVGVADRQADSAVLRFEVTDTGIGFDARRKRQLFDAFTQADAGATRRYGGTGLGLAICKELVSLMGGDIDAESEPGRGSRFWFTIHADIGSEAAMQRARRRSARGTRGRVLVAEDNIVNQRVAVGMLERLGFEADVAADGRETLHALEHGDYDAVLMDCIMPEMDGFETTRHIREKESGSNRHLPVIAMTASVLEGDRDRCFEAGMDEYLTKPIRHDALLRAIERVLAARGRRARRPRRRT